MSRVLVVEDSATQAMKLRILLEDAGFVVEHACDGVEGLVAVERFAPDVVLTDLDMPRMNGLELVEMIRARHPEVPVILMTALGSEEIAVQALQKGAASYVPKRSLDDAIAKTLRGVLEAAASSQHQHRVLECLTKTEFTFSLSNDPALVPLLIGHIREHTGRMKFGDETELTRINMAMSEALFNAIYHGNLEVSSDLRQDDERVFYQLAEARRVQAPYKDRRVEVTATVAPGRFTVVIRDDGPGFDPSGLPDPTGPANLDRIGGRGLLLIRTFMDEVSLNPKGNEITLVKRTSRPTTDPPPGVIPAA